MFLAYALAKILILNSSEDQPVINFPTLATPDIDFIDVSGGCSSFVDCTEYLANIIFNIGAGIIFLVLFIINLLVYLFQLFGLLLEVTFTGIDGAPFWVNALLTTPFLAAIAFILYRLIRQGESAD